MSIRARREALNWTRKDLAQRAQVDPSVIQLLELGQWTDEEAKQKCEAALKAAEDGLPQG